MLKTSFITIHSNNVTTHLSFFNKTKYQDHIVSKQFLWPGFPKLLSQLLPYPTFFQLNAIRSPGEDWLCFCLIYVLLLSLLSMQIYTSYSKEYTTTKSLNFYTTMVMSRFNKSTQVLVIYYYIITYEHTYFRLLVKTLIEKESDRM